jgi:hypothetical protein
VLALVPGDPLLRFDDNLSRLFVCPVFGFLLDLVERALHAFRDRRIQGCCHGR